MVWAKDSATDGGTILTLATYVYDALNNRIEKDVWQSPGPTTITRFGYDGQDVWADLSSTNALQSRYLRGDLVDQLFARIQGGTGGTAAWYLTDRQGSVRAIVDNTGTPIDHIGYDGYGAFTGETAPSVGDRYKYAGREYDAETGLQYNRARYWDPTRDRWTSQDPIGFASGDNNLYRYVGDNMPNATDPSGLDQFPSDKRGAWVEGTRGNGVFEYANTVQNRAAGIAGQRVRFANQCIGIGGFPAQFYYRGSAAAASVPIATIKGPDADFTAANRAMREKLNDPNWQQPAGYTWNHAGDSTSKTMELVQSDAHAAIAHEGSAALPRAERRLAQARGGTARVLAGLDAYLTFRDAAQAAGILKPDYDVITAPYYFVADDKSVFIIQKPPSWFSWFSSYKQIFVAGPRTGQTEDITNESFAKYQEQAEAQWGKYIPGSWFRDPRFIPGTSRETLPLYDGYNEIGYVDEEGVHRYLYPRNNGI
jgi:RHS repeat-associated protein